MKCMECDKHGMVFCAMGDVILKSELCCQANENKVVVAGATKAVMVITEAPKWCPLKMEAKE